MLPRSTVLLACTMALWAFPGTAECQSGRFDVFVSSQGTNSVKRYDAETGSYLGDFVAPGSGGLAQTQEVLIGPDGHLYVTGFATPSILKFDGFTGSFIEAFSSGYSLNQATKMAYGPDGDLYVSQWAGRRTVVRFDGTTGQLVGEVTPPLTQPMQMAWSDDGTLHVVDFGSRDVMRFDPSGQPLDPLVPPGPLRGPVNMWFEGDDDLLVVDWRAGIVRRFDATDGSFKGNFVAGLSNAEGWDYGPDGRLYVADWAAHQVNAYDSTTGAFVETRFSGGGLQTPNSVLFFERAPDFGVSAAVASVSLAPGATATVPIDVLPDRGLAFTSTVNLRCTGLPAWATCSFAPSSVTPGESGAQATLSVTTVLTSGAQLLRKPLANTQVRPWFAGLGLLLGLGLALGWRKRRDRLPLPTTPDSESGVSTLGASMLGALALGLLGLALSVVLIACGGDSGTGPTGPERAVITIEATSGAIQRSTSITVFLGS